MFPFSHQNWRMNSWSKHHRPGFSSLVVALLAMSAGGVPAAAEILPGPVLAEVVEIIALVALNIFTNLIGKATQVDIDFPRVSLLQAA